MKYFKFLVPFLAPLLVLASGQDDKYLITAPKIIRPNTQFQFSLVTSAVPNVTFILKVQIKSSSGSVLVGKNFSMKATGKATIVKLLIPVNAPDYSYIFYVEATGGYSFSDSHDVIVNRNIHSLFVQTDKALYKPGQKVNYRVLAIDPQLKPYKDAINITIYDTSNNKISKLVNQKNKAGVITSELNLSDVTPLGSWRIVAETKYTTAEKRIQVAEYVLPKFDVKVNLPSFYYINQNNPSLQEDLHISVVSMYSYGKPVKGTVSVEIKLAYNYWWWGGGEQNKILKNIELSDGKGDLDITYKELTSLLPQNNYWMSLSYQTLNVQANVTETITGTMYSGSGQVQCKTERLALQFLSNSPNYFMSGLPYYGFLRLTKSDSSVPSISDVKYANGTYKKVSITATPQYQYWSQSNSGTSKVLTATLDANGYAKFTFPTDVEGSSISFQANYMDEVSNQQLYSYQYANKFNTRDKAGVMLLYRNADNVIRPKTKAHFTVMSVTELESFLFQIFAKGLLVFSATVYPKVVSKQFSFYVYISEQFAVQLAPEGRFTVSFVTTDGELICDSLAINVADYFINKVSLSFSKSSTEPGDDDVVLNIKTSNNSFVSLLAVDQSVLMMSAGNDISKNMVSTELQKYINDYSSCYNCNPNYPRHLGYSDTNSVLDSTGVFVLTNYYLWKPPPPPTWIPWFPQPMPDYPVMEEMPMLGMTVPVSMPMPMMTTMMMMLPTMADKVETPSMKAPSAPAQPPPVVVRQDFPETWMWTDVQSNKNGDYVMKVKVPDSITSWVATGFSVNQQAGLGLSETPAKITVLKPFFITQNLPYSIIRGEEFALQVTVSNYMGQDLTVEMKLLESTFFKVIECGSKNLTNANVTKQTQVKNNDVASVYFWIVATSLGQIPIEVVARAGLAADAVKDKLLVKAFTFVAKIKFTNDKPEGQTESYSTSSFIQISAGNVFNTSFNISLPPKGILVEGSAIIEITVIGDIIGSTMNNIDDLLQMPYGCGEQTLLNLAPDVFLLKYFTESGKLTAQFEEKAKGFIVSGYQRELTYQRFDGSFSAFGNDDRSGSVWLSSFVIKCFHQAKQYIPIEDSKTAGTINWIVGLQGTDGTFKEPLEGRVIHTDMQGGSSSGLAMTAFVLIALLENKDNTLVNVDNVARSIQKSTSYLETQFSSYSTDPYALAIISYALYKAGSPKLNEVLSLLDGLAINENGLKYWKKDEEQTQQQDTWYRPYNQAKASSIEIASYVLLVRAQQKDLSKSLPIAKWLLKQRNSLGGFSSTQDTVLGLEALSTFASLITTPASSAGVTISIKGNTSPDVHVFKTITRESSLFLQSYQLPEPTTLVDVSATGDGVAIVQLNVKYNIEKENTNKFLNLALSTNSTGGRLSLQVSTNWNGTEVTGMVLIEINILTGYTLANEKELSQQIGTKFKKFEKSPNKIIIYLDELTLEYLTFEVVLEETLAVANVKPALVKVYRYYETASAVTGFYSSSSSQTWEGACPMCCP